jgi:hypothetical protein
MRSLRSVKQEVDNANSVDDRASSDAEIPTEKWRGPLPGQLADEFPTEPAVLSVQVLGAESVSQPDNFFGLTADGLGNPEIAVALWSSHETFASILQIDLGRAIEDLLRRSYKIARREKGLLILFVAVFEESETPEVGSP